MFFFFKKLFTLHYITLHVTLNLQFITYITVHYLYNECFFFMISNEKFGINSQLP